MKKLFLFLVLVPLITTGQTEYLISGFSEKYYAQLIIFPGYEDEVFKKGSISVFSTVTKEELIRIESEELTVDLDETGQVKINVTELPYGEQSIIIYRDFNFDGIKDLAVMDGQYSCYHGPSFQVFLELENKLVFSPEFTDLAQHYCGMFDVDYETKNIYTMTKSGCCWHQYSEFIVDNNVPVAMKIVEEGLNFNYRMWDYTEYNRVDGKLIEKSYSIIDTTEIQEHILFLFTLKNGKSMYLIQSQNNELCYVFADKDGVVELLYSNDFVYSNEKKTLSFRNKDARYEVSSTGIQVTVNGKVITMQALENTKRGSIGNVLREPLVNLKF